MKYLSNNKRGVLVSFLLLLLLVGCQTPNQINPQKSIAGDTRTGNVQKTIRKQIISKINVNAEDPLNDADAVYEGNEDILEGVYIYQKLVFVVVSVDLNKKYQIEPEGVAMLRENRMLRNRFTLPEKFSINRTVVKNEENDDSTFYQYVTAYRLQDIQKLQHNPK